MPSDRQQRQFLGSIWVPDYQRWYRARAIHGPAPENIAKQGVLLVADDVEDDIETSGIVFALLQDAVARGEAQNCDAALQFPSQVFGQAGKKRDFLDPEGAAEGGFHQETLSAASIKKTAPRMLGALEAP